MTDAKPVSLEGSAILAVEDEAAIGVFPLAESLTALRVPFAFTSGHPRALMPPTLHGRPFPAKPYGEGDIIALVNKLLAPSPG